MAFTTPCFVRVEDRYERKKLIELLKRIGWRFRGIASPEKKYVVADAHHQTVTTWVLDEWGAERFENIGYIFCGTNVELFKALAAMNDENDREQWFVVKKNISDWYDIDDIVYQKGDMFFNDSGEPLVEKNFRKATTEEIISYFKNKENE